MTESLAILLDHVQLTLGHHAVLRDVSLAAPRGQTTVILGGSGSGKTTILRVILGLYRPDSGAVVIDGTDITGMAERDLSAVRQSMAMVFQNAALFDSLTVGDNVGYRLREQRVPEETVEATIHDSLRFVGLDDIVEKMPAELSGGMRKRVGIARALASGAPILLYDEPTAGLDPINTCMISRLIKSCKVKGKTQIVVTHDLETANSVADRIVMMQKGRVIFDGTPTALQASDQPAIRGFLDPSTLRKDERQFPQPEPETAGERR
jgi:phospholipid/cholesterol/gamma-HCH transport system ATP-binding protein